MRDHIATDRLDVGRVVHAAEAEDDVLSAGIGELSEAIDDLGGRLGREVHALERRSFDLIRIATDSEAVAPQDLVLVLDRSRTAEDVQSAIRAARYCISVSHLGVCGLLTPSRKELGRRLSCLPGGSAFGAVRRRKDADPLDNAKPAGSDRLIAGAPRPGD